MKAAMEGGQKEGDGSSESGTDSTSLLRFITLIFTKFPIWARNWELRNE